MLSVRAVSKNPVTSTMGLLVAIRRSPITRQRNVWPKAAAETWEVLVALAVPRRLELATPNIAAVTARRGVIIVTDRAEEVRQELARMEMLVQVLVADLHRQAAALAVMAKRVLKVGIQDLTLAVVPVAQRLEMRTAARMVGTDRSSLLTP